jgi:hypothetical protein
MAHTLVGDDLVDSDEDTRLLDVAEVLVDRRAEDTHLGRECHVGIDQRGDIQPDLTYRLVQRTVVLQTVIRGEELADLGFVDDDGQRIGGAN